MTKFLSLSGVFWALFLLDAGVVLLGVWSSYSHRAGGGAAVNGLQLALAMIGGLATAPLGLLFLFVRYRPARIVLLGLLFVTNLFLVAIL